MARDWGPRENERTCNGEEHDLRLVRQGCRGRCALLCRDLSRQLGGAIWRAPGDYPSGKKGDVLVVEFKVAGVSCIGLNGGPQFKHNEAFSFVIPTDNQAEHAPYWT